MFSKQSFILIATTVIGTVLAAIILKKLQGPTGPNGTKSFYSSSDLKDLFL